MVKEPTGGLSLLRVGDSDITFMNLENFENLDISFLSCFENYVSIY